MFRYRNVLFPLVVLLLIVVFPPQPNGTRAWLDAFGILLVAVGEALRITVVGLAYIKRGGLNKRVYASELVTTGLFAHCRNPLYLGNLTILLGLLVITQNLWTLPPGAGFFVFSYAAIISAEEAFLSRKFGQAYQEYCVTVPRWLPVIDGLGQTIRSMQFNWRRVLVKEYSTVTALIVTICMILGYRRLLESETSPLPVALAGPVAISATAVAVAVLIRLLKKNGRLAGSSG